MRENFVGISEGDSARRKKLCQESDRFNFLTPGDHLAKSNSVQ
jgi:hypothetical protein